MRGSIPPLLARRFSSDPRPLLPADLKLDGCGGRSYPQINTSWIKFRSAIDACSKRRGFPMVLSVESCDDPTGCGLWIGKLANLWRTCGDIQATFASVMRNVADNTKMAEWAGPTGGPLGGGHWNDVRRDPFPAVYRVRPV